jgi:hypothetical protein
MENTVPLTSYEKKLANLIEKIEFFSNGKGFPQLLIIYGDTLPYDKEAEIAYALSKVEKKDVVIHHGVTINDELKLFNVLNENNGKVIFIREYWAPTLLNEKVIKTLRDAIGWTSDGEKWDKINYKGVTLNFTGKVILESRLPKLDSSKIKNSNILQYSDIFDFSISEKEYFERYTYKDIYKIASFYNSQNEKIVENFQELQSILISKKNEIEFKRNEISLYRIVELADCFEEKDIQKVLFNRMKKSNY